MLQAGLFNAHYQLHFGVDVAADHKGPAIRKGFGNILARILLVGVEGETRRLDVDLVDEVVIVGEGQAFATIDADLGRAEGAAFLDDGVRLVGRGGGNRD